MGVIPKGHNKGLDGRFGWICGLPRPLSLVLSVSLHNTPPASDRSPMMSRAAVMRSLFSTPRHLLRIPSVRSASSASATSTPSAVTSSGFSVTSSPSSPTAFVGDVLVIGAFADAIDADSFAVSDATLKEISSSMTAGVLEEIIVEEEFKAEPGSSVRARGTAGTAKTVCIVGMGKASDATPAAFRKFGEAAAAEAKKGKPVSVGVAVANAATPPSAKEADAITTGLSLGAFSDERFKDPKKRKPFTVEKIELLGLEGGEQTDAAIDVAEKIAAGANLTRELVNAPPNMAAPRHLAETAADIAAKTDRMTLKVLEKDECEKWGECGMGLYLGVAQASDEPPKFIHLKYTNPKAGADAKKIGIVGKGVTFDAGGLNIKAGPGSMIELMKFDMGGAGATLGAAAPGRRGAFCSRGMREHDLGKCYAPGRHSHRGEWHDRGGEQHGRRGTTDARRRALVRAGGGVHGDC